LQFVRKLAAKSAKLIVKLAPQKWVDNLKQNPKLVAAYSNNLHKSGLMYQLQTIEELKLSYADYLQHQNTLVTELLNSNTTVKCTTSLVVCVVNFEPNNLLVTLSSIKAQYIAFSNIVFLCNNNNKVQLNDFLNLHLDLPFLLSANKPCFVIYAGDALERYAAFILTTKIKPTTQLAYVDTDTLNSKGERGRVMLAPVYGLIVLIALVNTADQWTYSA